MVRLDITWNFNEYSCRVVGEEDQDGFCKYNHYVRLIAGDWIEAPITPYDHSCHTVNMWIVAGMPKPNKFNWDKDELLLYIDNKLKTLMR